MPYTDPFLVQRKPQRWDLAAERYSTAVTLYEMSMGLGVLPQWGDGKSDPAMTEDELCIHAEQFDPSVREGLVEFFLTALHRDPERRFDNAEEMRWAWQQVFKEADQRKVRTPSGEEVDLSVSLEAVDLKTPIAALGLSTRARNALERANILSVRNLLEYPIGENTAINEGLREAYTQIEKGGRTAQAFEVWREDYLDQVAVAWVLGGVFVRFMEDNHLIDECWLAGEGDRRKLAEDRHELYFRDHPHESDREYFEHVFHEVGKIPACRDLFAEGKTPLWAVAPSGDAVMKLLAFWREIDAESGHLKRSLEVEDGDTRFLGDLYQDLSERARKKYALLQTPDFIEEFILDHTLDPATDEFGLDEVRMIDPTCGSGHFLLGAFARLFDLWIKREENVIVAANKSLDGVWGVDINPFAVAIARFRLIVAALRVCGITRLRNAPAWNIRLATGDSLLFGNRWTKDGKKKAEQQFLRTEDERWAPDIYACEDREAAAEVLGQQYHAVVGNPPYVVMRDRRLNSA